MTVALLLAFGLSLVLTLGCERLARRAGIVARPAAERWHRAPVPLLGGVAIMVATLGPLAPTLIANPQLVVFALTAIALGGVGLVDDLRPLSPQVKLLAQIVLAATLLHFGAVLHLTGYRFVDVFITLFWIVGITNAFNLLDNMDGLAASIALIAAAFRLVFFHWEGDPVGVWMSATFIGAVAGFLVRNVPPARIFMGDTGSFFLGFFLSGLSVVGTNRAYSRGVVAVLVIPVLLLMIPIFDTAFVTATRLLSGRRIAVGGRDHTSHRLVAIGLSERQTVLMLGGLSAAAGSVAVLSYRWGLSQAIVLLVLFVIALVLLGIYLSRVRVVSHLETRPGRAVLQLFADFQYKRQVLTMSLDVCLILVAYYASYMIRFEEAFPQYRLELYGSLPTVLLIQLLAFAGFGLYRGIWQYVGVADMLRIAKAATVGTMATLVVLLYTQHFAGFSRSVFVIDWLLLVVLVGGSRASFRFLTEMLRPAPESFQRVVIYGAGDGGELIVRELLNNPALQRVPIGFVDDDRSKHRTRIHGLPVFGGRGKIQELVRRRGVTEVIISSSKIQGDGLDLVTQTCRELDVSVRRAAFRIE